MTNHKKQTFLSPFNQRQMKKILISWIAFNRDFERGTEGSLVVSSNGPNTEMHKSYFEYDEHILLHTNRHESEYKADLLRTELKRNYPEHNVRLHKVYLSEQDLINLSIIQAKIKTVMMDFRDAMVDIFVTPGTPAMHTVWHITHLDSDLNTRLLQLRPGKYTETGKAELIEIDFDHSEIPGAAMIQEKNLSKDSSSGNIIKPKALEKSYDLAKQIARTDKVSCLILGESGTGKEVMAKYILNNSPRKAAPFKAINCSALPDELLTSLLFGHKKGSFTGALKDFQGYFEQADGGTIFLDEIGDISPFMQQSLLRVLQEKEVMPIGADSPVMVDVRIIAATNQNLIKLCKEGKFRWDLYYRLSVVEIQLPQLAEWGKTAIRDLFDFFLNLKKEELGKSKRLQLSKKIKQALLNYHYPGNIREMENLVARLYVTSENEIQMRDLPESVRESYHQSPLKLDAMEENHIRRVLRLRDANLTQTAKALGIHFNTLKSKMEKYNISQSLVP